MDGPRASSLRELRPDDPTRIGRYRIEAKIGEGGMGAVYLGRGEDGRPVAVKVVRAELAGDRTFLARFHDEAANAQRVASFCTAQVLEHGEDLGLAYIVTEYIDGPSLLDHVAENGALSPGMLHGVAVGVAAALVAIHSAGLVHRDLKPSNVLLSISGPRVIDFGIARALDMVSAHTRTGQVVGTPGWIAPEQITTQQVTTAVDVFAWGCLVAYAANGRNPFGQGSFQLLAARAVHAEPEIGDLPPSLSALVRVALSKDPGARPSARDLLLSLVGGGGEAAVTTELGESWSPPPGGDPGATARDTPPPPPAPVPEPEPPVPQPVTRPVYEQPHRPPYGLRERPTEREYTEREYAVPPPVLPTAAGGRAARRPSRRTTLAASAAAAVLAAGAVAGVLYYLGRPSEKAGTTTGAFPSAAMVVRIDTAPGWPKQCHADLGLYTPGEPSAKTLVGGPQCDMLPERSPDGKRIAFTRQGAKTAAAWVVNADGGGARKVVDVQRGTRVSWSPDGARLAYMAGKDGVRQIFTTTLDGHSVTQLTTDDSFKDDPMWSSTGRLVFWSRRDGTEQIYTLDPARPGSAWTPVTTDGVRSVDPEWSPDGSKIAFTRGPDEHSTIWVVNADGSGLRAVTTGTDDDMDPAWSADGRWLCYVRGDLADPVIHAVRADGTGDRVLTPGGLVLGHPDWS
ncbi:Putative serine/threonine-protein kinase PknA [Mycobacterium tuberculosis]|nr:Putative serine/threonine-protein kinase PknA [Mycobacterium tuberculosis]